MPRAPAGLQERFYAPRGWTWSGLKVGHEVWRYGVASPPMVPRGSLLILTGGEDPAEVWFETANDLIAKGYAVWLLEVHSSSAATDAPQRMVREVIRPRAGQALVVLADGFGANAALDSLSTGRPLADTLLVQRPVTQLADRTRWLTPTQAETAAHWAVKLHLDGLPAPEKPMASTQDAGFDVRRAALANAWRRSDPALRPTTPMWEWLDRYDLTARRAVGRFANVSQMPIVMADDSGALGRLCAKLTGCEDRRDIGHAGQMQTDDVRNRWLGEIVTLLERYRAAKP